MDKDQFEKVLGMIESGKKEGAKLEFGGVKAADKGKSHLSECKSQTMSVIYIFCRILCQAHRVLQCPRQHADCQRGDFRARSIHFQVGSALEKICHSSRMLLGFRFSTMEELIERANKTSYGLAAGILTKDINKALMFAQAVQAGSVWINTYDAVQAQTPFGGFKQSGIGRELGPEGIHEYLECKTVTVGIPQKNS